MFRFAIVLPLVLLAAIQLPAQPKPKPKPKPPPIKPEPLTLIPGQPMSALALTQRPAPLKGLRGWTLETKHHRGPIYSFAFSPDEKLLATGGHDGIIRLWDPGTGKLLRALVGHNHVVTSLAFSPDGNILASAGSSDGTVRLWDPAEAQPLRTFPMKMGYASYVAWSPDGRTLACVGGTSGYIWLYDIAGDSSTIAAETGNPIYALAWASDSHRLAVCSVRTPLWMIDTAASSDKVKTFGDVADAPQSLAWSPDDKVLAAGSASAVYLWDPAEKKKIDTLATAGAVLAWSRDGKTLATSGSLGQVTYWDPESRKMHRPAVAGTSASAMRWQNNDVLAMLTYTTLSLWKQGGDKAEKTFELGGQTPPQWYAGRPVITGLGENTLALWSATSGKRIALLEGHTAPVAAAAWSKDGKQLATGGYDGRVLFWDSAGKRLATAEKAGTVLSLSWAPDGKQIACGATDANVRIFESATGNLVRTFEGHGAAVYALAWCPSGKLLAAGGYDKPVKVWSLETGKADALSKEWPAGQALGWSPNGKLLATGGASDALRFWAPVGKAPAQIGERAPQPPVTLLSWAPGNEVLAVCRTGSGVYLYGVNGKLLHSFSTWASASSVGWSAKAETIAIGAQDRMVRFWDTGTGQQRATLIAEPAGSLALIPEGFFKGDPSVEADVLVVTQTERGQETLPVSRFATKYKWKNQPALVKLTR